MDSSESSQDNHLRIAYLLLKLAPLAIEMYIDSHFPGGFVSALKEKACVLKTEALADQQKMLANIESGIKHKLHYFYEDLVNNTILEQRVMDYLISMCILTTDDRDEIMQHAKITDRNKTLLNMLIDRPFNTVDELIMALKNESPNYDELLDRIEKFDYCETMPTRPCETLERLSSVIAIHKVRLQKNYSKIVQDMTDTSRVIDELIAHEVLQPDDSTELSAYKTQSETNRRLIAKIRTSKQYDCFIKALQSDDINIELADRIEETEVTQHDLQFLTWQTGIQSNHLRDKLGIHLMIRLLEETANCDLPAKPLPRPRFRPLAEDVTIHADISRCKMFTTQLIDSRFEKIITTAEMMDTVKSMLVRIGGETFIKECDHVIHTECCTRHIDGINVAKDILKEAIKRTSGAKEILDCVPTNIREHMCIKLKTWIRENEEYVPTQASKHIHECLKINGCVSVIGSSGVGKTATVRHVALLMQDEGYDILPITVPKEIIDYHVQGKPTLFVLDNFCGNYSANQQQIDNWKMYMEDVKIALEDEVCKLILSCRLHVFQDQKLATVTIIQACQCKLGIGKLALTGEEKDLMAKDLAVELSTDDLEILGKFDFFPLLCRLLRGKGNTAIKKYRGNPFYIFEVELDEMLNEGESGKYQFCSLAVLVMFNNNLYEEVLIEGDNNSSQIIDSVCDVCELNKGTSRWKLKAELDAMQGTYITKDRFIYRTIHDKLFDFISYYFGRRMIHKLIQFGHSSYLRERFLWRVENLNDTPYSTNRGSTTASNDTVHDYDFITILPDSLLSVYQERMINDWSRGNVADVFLNVNMKNQAFREKLLYRLTSLDKHEQEKLAQTNDRLTDSTAFYYCCYYDDDHFVEWFIQHDADFRKGDGKGNTPLHIACQKDRLNTVATLLRMTIKPKKKVKKSNPLLSKIPFFLTKSTGNKTLINDTDKDGKTPLFEACLEQNFLMVCKLLEYNADVNKCNTNEESPLFIASKLGDLQTLSKLLEYDVDINKKNEKCHSPLYVACQNGQDRVVEKLLEHNADINLTDKNGNSPLCVACYYNQLGVVCILLEHGVNTSICNFCGESPLHIACEYGCLEIVSKLLEYTKDINKSDHKGESPFYKACAGKSVNVVRKLLEYNAEINKCNIEGASPLNAACRYGNLAIVSELLQNNAHIEQITNSGMSPLIECSANVNQVDNYSLSPLFTACYYDYLEIVNELLHNHADINICNGNDESPLYISCYRGSLQIVSKLLEYKADTNKCTKAEISPLYIASKEGHFPIVCELLKVGANVNKSDFNGISPLHIACYKGHVNIVKILLDYNAYINGSSYDGVSPLYTACYYGLWETVKVLLDNGSDINKSNNGGATPLYTAIQEGHLQIVSELLKQDADINKSTRHGVSPLLKACQTDQFDIVSTLLEFKADINNIDLDGASCLHVACQNGNLSIVEILLENNSDINMCKLKGGASPLHVACYKGFLRVVSKLLEFNVNINLRDTKERSPLFVACQEGHLNVVNMLLENDADINICNKRGLSPLDISALHGHADIVTALGTYKDQSNLYSMF